MRVTRIAVLASCLMALTSACQAATIFNNLGPGDTFSVGGRVVQGPDVGTIGDVNQGSSFTVGSTDHYLTSLTLGISVMNPPQDGPGPIDIVLAADAGGAPGAALRTLPTNVGSPGDQLVTVVDDGSLLLDANTTYWVLMDGEGEFNGSWRFNVTGDMGLTAGQTEPNPWNPRAPEERYALRVEGRAAVPEPGTMAMALGLLTTVAATRRRSRS